MKIRVDENSELSEIEVVINCPSNNDQVNKIIQILSTNYYNIIGKKDGDNYVLNLDDIFYFEAVDNHVFAYCEKDIYEVTYKIQELTDMLNQTYFIQTSRTIVLNIKKIKKVTTLVNGRILAVLNNNEKMIITRVYAQKFKAKLKE
ncbi:MAG: LytTR family DNA-binding domain-containing protein [Bacilli bacterium]|nr:LytTR family transcriptional regulator DNA-binding domain-containing protein [Bacilli bacterium]MDD7315265.1 LytTR family DNA-binding domain-containing protein [Bacilli bacterium]MDY4051731.1 LytTR family DNA-binding domain-containing protein [Bacilli bacterium]